MIKGFLQNIALGILGKMVESVSTEQVKAVSDMALDWVENVVEDSKNEYDNALVLPLIGILRKAYGIEDNE